MRRRVTFFAVVAMAGAIGSFLGAERKLSVLAEQAQALSMPDQLSASLIVDGGDLATALEGLQDVSPSDSSLLSDTRETAQARTPQGISTSGLPLSSLSSAFPPGTDSTTPRFVPAPAGSVQPWVYEFRGNGMVFQRKITLGGGVMSPSQADRLLVSPQGTVEITPLAPGTRIAIRVIGRIPTLSKDERID